MATDPFSGEYVQPVTSEYVYVKMGAEEERAACAEILREAGCVCVLTGKRELGDWRWVTDDLAAGKPYWKLVDHHSSCPVALLARVEARRREVR